MPDLIRHPCSSKKARLIRGGRCRHNELFPIQLRHRPIILMSYLQPVLTGGWVEMTQPHSPKSPMQQVWPFEAVLNHMDEYLKKMGFCMELNHLLK